MTQNPNEDEETDKLPPQRDERGHFLPGHKLRPIGKPGPMTKEEKAPYLKAITETFSADDLSRMLLQSWAMAVKMEDWRGMLELIRFVAAYQVGKPISRNINAQINPEDILKIFTGVVGAGAEGTATIIDVPTSKENDDAQS